MSLVHKVRHRTGLIYHRMLTGKTFADMSIRKLQRANPEQPVPLDILTRIQRRARCADCLTPPGEHRSFGRECNDSWIAEHLRTEQIGHWGIGAPAINYLDRQFSLLHPSRVLEFGSGYSTVCLAHLVRKYSDDATMPCVFSVEEQESYAQETRCRLARYGMEHAANVETVPLKRQAISGRETVCYDLDGAACVNRLMEALANFCFIDGPSSLTGSRMGVLPKILPLLAPGAMFAMDDALRDAELDAARLWATLPNVSILGVVLTGKGLLVGRKEA